MVEESGVPEEAKVGARAWAKGAFWGEGGGVGAGAGGRGGSQTRTQIYITYTLAGGVPVT